MWTELFQSFPMICQEDKKQGEAGKRYTVLSCKMQERRKSIVRNYEGEVPEEAIQGHIISLHRQPQQAAVFHAGSLQWCSDSHLAYADVTPLTLASLGAAELKSVRYLSLDSP